MLAGSGGCLGDSSSDGGGAAFGDDDAVSPGGIGGAEDGSEIVRVFDAVEHDDQRILCALGGDHVREVVILLGGGDGDHALMRCVARHAVKFGALRETSPARRSCGIPR